MGHKDPHKAKTIIHCAIGLTRNASANPKQAVPASNERVTSYCKNSTELIKILELLPVRSNAYIFDQPKY